MKSTLVSHDTLTQNHTSGIAVYIENCSWALHSSYHAFIEGHEIARSIVERMQVYLARKKPVIFNSKLVALKVIFLGNPRLSEASKALLKQGM
jgi:hypothetical protein